MTQSSHQNSFLQAGYYGAFDNGVVTRLVVHDEEMAVGINSAEDVANFFHNMSSTNGSGSANYEVVANSVVGSVFETQVAYHAPPNQGSLGVEHDGYSRFTAADWNLPGSQATLHRSALLFADMATRHDIPVVKLSAQDLIDGKHGICGHGDVSACVP